MKKQINNPHMIGDIVIIGSGITGLCAGALLAKSGNHVVVLEANLKYYGGHARTLHIHGSKFCAGPQFVWNFFGDAGEVGSRVFRFLEIEGEIPFLRFDAQCQDRVFLGEKDPIDIPQGLENFRETLISNFPQDSENISRFFRYLDSLFKASVLLHDQGKYLLGKWDMLISILFSTQLNVREKVVIAKLFNKTLSEVFDLCNLSEEPRRVLFAHGGIFAENPDSISIGIFAAATGYCHNGISFPINGFDSLVRGLCKSIEDNGGSLSLGKKVKKIYTEDKTANIVECSDGSTYNCDYVISSLSPRKTCELIPGCHPTSYKYDPSNSLVGCFIGVDISYNLESIHKKNYWWLSYPGKVDYNNPDMTKPPGMLFIGSETSNGVSQSKRPNDVQTLTIFVPGNYEQSRASFEDGPRKYKHLKDIISENVLNTLEDFIFPDIMSSIKFIEVFTPWDIYQELGSEAGNVYGRKSDVENLLRKVKRIEGINNISLANATIGMPGVETGFQTALILFKELTGTEI